ncbi:MAG TPA: HD domain-containing phosphohydrolase, partial [Candidatus Brocadiaceae bacterium]
VFWRKDGTSFPVYYTSTPVLENDKIVGAVVTFGDVTERKKNERRLAAQHEVTKILAESDTVKEAFPKILQTICEGINWGYGEIWLVDEQNNVLRCAELWHSPLINMPEFIAMTRGMALTSDYALPGKVWVDGKPLWVPDVTHNPGCVRAAVALKEGMHSAFFFPIVGDNRILGVMGFFSSNIVEEEDTLMRISAIGRQIGMFLLRKHAEEHARTQMQHLIALRDIDKAIISSLDLNVTIDVFLDRAFQQLNADAIDVLLFDPYMQALRYAGGRGFITTQIQHTRIHLGEGLTGTSLLENCTICIPDVSKSNEIILQKEMFAQESFAAYYCMPLTAKGQMKGVIEVYYRKPIQHGQEWTDFLETLAGQAAIAIDNATLFKDLRRSNIELLMAYDSTIEGWARALDLRDRETEGHSRRVTELTVQVATAIGLVSEADIIHVRRGALLHDIGKMGIPDGILLKDKPLNEEEWTVMKKHPIYSYNLLSPIAYLHPAIDIPYCHHEKWDGTGYPRGLKGEQIPLAARIFAVVDVWDAMRSDRPYRKGIPAKEVREHIRSLAGTQFDPKVVEVFL